ncbi:DUF2800 domain-containing protein [Photorhabdus sp. SF281]|uniref:DUF2800 domain-containing protein n=1 Tax=Photorhabdus sp. SF281 TaxID=3459527 RepID=UPI0040441BE6
MPELHAKLSPSSAHRWLNCSAALAIEQFEPDTTTSNAQEGSAAHALAECVLRNRLQAATHGLSTADYLGTYPLLKAGTPQVDQTMVEYVGEYVETIWNLAQDGDLFIEERVDFSNVTDVENSFGTADAIIIKNDELQIHDLKYGYEKVDAFENPQLMLYVLGAINQFGLLYDFNSVRMFIHQPRINHVSEYACSIDNLNEFGQNVKSIAANVLAIAEQAAVFGQDSIPTTAFQPGEKTCRWCKRRGKCPAQAAYVSASLLNDFDVIDDPVPVADALQIAQQQLAKADSQYLGEMLHVVDEVEAWCKGVRDAAFTTLQNGLHIPGFKLIVGKPGNRTWSNEADAEALFKKLKIKKDEMYQRKLLTPPQAEKLLKKSNLAKWEKLEGLIIRPDGKPTIAPESDPRESFFTNLFNDFEDIEAAESLI